MKWGRMMKIVNLIENTCAKAGLLCEHGLSFYLATPEHKILMDSGASDKFLHNAERLGVDLSAVDVAVLSHGHYDHCGGVPAFAKKNPHAAIYLRAGAAGEFYHVESDYSKYIGIDKNILALPQLQVVQGDLQLDDELFIFGDVEVSGYQPRTNQCLKVKKANCEYIADDFCHEQYLEVSACGKRVLFSGCAHNGIVNIMQSYCRLRKKAPDLVISGFHTMNLGNSEDAYTADDVAMMKDIALQLKQYDTLFYTCHCTGSKPFEIFRSVLGEQIQYISTGDILEI